jgi:hypothetical protein
MAVKRTKALGSTVPAIGIFAPATKYHETSDSRPSDPVRTRAKPGTVSVIREKLRVKLLDIAP